MGIYYVQESREQGTGKVDRNGYTYYTRVFEVGSTDWRTRQALAIAAVQDTGLNIGDYYQVLDPADNSVIEYDPNSYLLELSSALASSSEDGCLWLVTGNYGPAGGENATFPPNPLDHPIELSWGSERVDIVVDRDVNGNAVTNSAGDFFEENPPTIEKYRIILTIQRNESSFSPTLALTWKGTVNNAAWTVAGTSFAAYTVKCLDITSNAVYHPACGWFWPVKYDFAIDLDGWRYKPLDRGVRMNDGSGKRAILDSQGQPIPDPVLLNGSGLPLTGGTPVVLTFNICPLSDFSLLNFDYTNAPGY